MAFPADARHRKLTRQFPGEDIWKLIEQGTIKDAADWLREEIAAKEWDYEAAEAALDTNRAHLWRIIHREKSLSTDKVVLFAIKFGHVRDDAGEVTISKIEYIVALFGRRRVRYR